MFFKKKQKTVSSQLRLGINFPQAAPAVDLWDNERFQAAIARFAASMQRAMDGKDQPIHLRYNNFNDVKELHTVGFRPKP